MTDSEKNPRAVGPCSAVPASDGKGPGSSLCRQADGPCCTVSAWLSCEHTPALACCLATWQAEERFGSYLDVTHTHTTFLLNWNGIVRIGQLAKEENRVGESLDYDKRRTPYGPRRWLSSLCFFFFFFLHPTSGLLKRVPKPHLPSVCTTQCDDLSNLTIFVCFSWGSVLRARVPRSQGWPGMSWSLSPRFIWLSVVKRTPPVVLPAHFSEFSLSQWKVNLSAAVSTVRNGAVF